MPRLHLPYSIVLFVWGFRYIFSGIVGHTKLHPLRKKMHCREHFLQTASEYSVIIHDVHFSHAN